MADPILIHGWTALPLDSSVLLHGRENLKVPQPVMVDDVRLPDTDLAKKVLEYARKELKEETYNHSMRVFYYGAFLQHNHTYNHLDRVFGCSRN